MCSQLGARPSGYLWENVSLWASSSLEKHCTRVWLISVVSHPTHRDSRRSIFEWLPSLDEVEDTHDHCCLSIERTYGKPTMREVPTMAWPRVSSSTCLVAAECCQWVCIFVLSSGQSSKSLQRFRGRQACWRCITDEKIHSVYQHTESERSET